MYCLFTPQLKYLLSKFEIRTVPFSQDILDCGAIQD